jgi:hypothetical protein
MRPRGKARPALDANEFVYQLARDADGFVHTERGYIAAKNYETLRAAHPELRLPRWQDLPRICDLSTQDLQKLRLPCQLNDSHETQSENSSEAPAEPVRPAGRA